MVRRAECSCNSIHYTSIKINIEIERESQNILSRSFWRSVKSQLSFNNSNDVMIFCAILTNLI